MWNIRRDAQLALASGRRGRFRSIPCLGRPVVAFRHPAHTNNSNALILHPRLSTQLPGLAALPPPEYLEEDCVEE